MSIAERNIAELVTGVQFTVDQTGKVTAVVLTPELWERIVELLEDSEDRELVRLMQERLRQHPAASGALRWEDVEQDWA
jgi:hypothetical protein